MDKNAFRGYWNNLKPKIKSKWNRFTDEDLNHINGDLDKFLHKLHQYYGWDAEKAHKELCAFCESCGCKMERTEQSCHECKGPHHEKRHGGHEHKKRKAG